MPKLKLKTVKERLRETKGNITIAAQLLGVTRCAVHQFVNKHELHSIVDDARAAIVDHAESSLHRAVVNGEPWAVSLTLRTLGRNRGYVERGELEVTGKNGGPIEAKVTVFDHDAAVASITRRPGGDRGAPGESEGSGDGAPVG